MTVGVNKKSGIFINSLSLDFCGSVDSSPQKIALVFNLGLSRIVFRKGAVNEACVFK